MWPESRPAATHGVAWATGGRAEGGWYPAARGRAERGHDAPRGWPHATGETPRVSSRCSSL